MRLLTEPFQTERAASAPSIARPLAGVAAAAALGACVGLAAEAGFGAAGGMGHALASASVHAGFLASGWVVAFDGRTGWHAPALRGAAALLLASLAARVSPAGALAYLLVPMVLARDAGRWRGPLERIGWRAPCRPGSILLGAAAGMFLGLHLLIAASLTLGYAVSVPDAGSYLAVLAYDVGATKLSATIQARAERIIRNFMDRSEAAGALSATWDDAPEFFGIIPHPPGGGGLTAQLLSVGAADNELAYP